MSTFNRAIEASINCGGFAFKEGEWNFELSPPELPLGYIAADCYKMGHALRFLNIDIPPGQVIKNAYITYRAWASYDGDNCYGHIYGEKSLTPATFSTWADFEARPKTTNRIPWDNIPHWQDLGLYTTPNFSSVIQEIISQPGWVSGNPIALFCEDIEDRSSHVPNAYRKSWAYYEHYEWTPILTIEYGPETNFAVLDISYVHFYDFVVITLPTQIPCHLTCYYTHIKPVRHATTRILRGLALPWGAYWCFAAWKSVEQIEEGDTLIHTFKIHAWVECRTKWLTFRGTAIAVDSPSVGPLFEHHHTGGLDLTKILRPAGPGIRCSIPSEIGDPCPDHWKNVDDDIPDEELTQLNDTVPEWYGWAYDFFTIQELPPIPLEIDYVTLTARCRREGGDINQRVIRLGIRTHDRTSWPVPYPFVIKDWRDYKRSWALNPYTGQPWTYHEINELQIAIDLKQWFYEGVLERGFCTQMYLTIHFKPQES